MHGHGGGGGGGGGAEQQVDYPVPSNRAGVVIGKGGLSILELNSKKTLIFKLGETINQIKEKSGAFVQINKTPPQDHPDWKYFTIRGNQQQIATAQKLIQVFSLNFLEFFWNLETLQEKVGGPAPPGAAISASPASGGGYSYQQSNSYGQQGHYGQQYPGQSGQQQQDYSQAWAQYYAQVWTLNLIQRLIKFQNSNNKAKANRAQHQQRRQRKTIQKRGKSTLGERVNTPKQLRLLISQVPRPNRPLKLLLQMDPARIGIVLVNT